MCVCVSRGMQKITEQIQRQHEEKQLQDEVKELEKQQVREMQEKIILEDLEVTSDLTQTLQRHTSLILALYQY